MAEDFDDTTGVDDAMLIATFAGYRAETMAGLPAQDLAGVQARARRRRTVRISAAAVAAALAIAVPAVGYAVAGPDDERTIPAPPAPSTTAPHQPAPVPSDQGPPPTTTTAPAVPDGRISASELGRAGVDLPAWQLSSDCPTRRVIFRSNLDVAFTVTVMDITYSDVDGDGSVETFALLGCRIGQGPAQQVVGFDRDPSGAIVTLGQVVDMTQTPGQVQYIAAVRPGGNGTVGVQVGDQTPCCGIELRHVELQWRLYRYDGHRFRQSGGPTAFTPVPAAFGSVAVTVTPVLLGPASGGVRLGTTTVTVRNNGPGQMPGTRLSLGAYVPDTGRTLDGVTITGGTKGCAVETSATNDDATILLCHYPALAEGASGEYRFTVRWPVSLDPKMQPPGVGLSVSANVEQPGVRVLENPDGSFATMNVPISLAE